MNHNERLMTDEKQSFFVKLTFIFDPSYIFTSKKKQKCSNDFFLDFFRQKRVMVNRENYAKINADTLSLR